MKALLDTHTWLWWLTTPERLGPRAHDVMADPATELLFFGVMRDQGDFHCST